MDFTDRLTTHFGNLSHDVQVDVDAKAEWYQHFAVLLDHKSGRIMRPIT